MMTDVRRNYDSVIPAGYTYLGQFIIHDLTYMTPAPIKTARSPALDLDSVIGKSRFKDDVPFQLLPIGLTTQTIKPLPEDLPRRAKGKRRGKPIIDDPRNDDFLPLAQCHMIVSKFYNAIAREIGLGGWPNSAPQTREFRTLVRKLWLEHFQSVVLHDYLKRIVDPDTWSDVMQFGRRLVRMDTSRPDWLPLEFAAAIGRFGHSMVRDAYNRWTFDGTIAGVGDFMRFSHRNSEDGLREAGYGLPGDWITNWFRLFDFSDGPYSHRAEPPMYSARLDTRLAKPLGSLPSRLLHHRRKDGGGTPFNLASETLRRTFTLNMASAQEAIELLNGQLTKSWIRPLTFAELIEGECPAVVKAFEQHELLRTKTPLWYYTLKEADIRGSGNRLGPFASRIVMETLHAAIEASDVSILRQHGWRPSLPCASGRFFTMTDLIAFTCSPDVRGLLATGH
jgi:hypothetical protein